MNLVMSKTHAALSTTTTTTSGLTQSMYRRRWIGIQQRRTGNGSSSNSRSSSCSQKQKHDISHSYGDWIVSLVLLILGDHWKQCHARSYGLPGTTQTKSGYDTEMGVDAICWTSSRLQQDNSSSNINSSNDYNHNDDIAAAATAAVEKEESAAGGSSSSSGSVVGSKMKNPLVQNYVVSGVQWLHECPMGNNISGMAPAERTLLGERLRTGREYLFTVTLDINQTSLGAAREGFYSDIMGPGYIAVQVLHCLVGNSGFCSPFIHENANAREAAAAEAAAAAIATDSKLNENHHNTSVSILPAVVVPRGGLHGGSHVHSSYAGVNLPLSEGPVFSNVQIQIPMLVLTPGSYFVVVAAQMYFYSNQNDSSSSSASSSNSSFNHQESPQLWRYDMANALFGNDRLIPYQAPPEIFDVPDVVLYFSYVLIALCSAVILFLLVASIQHRNHQVMRLSQGPFLVVFLFFSLLASVTSFLWQPKNDFYCNASAIITGISLQVVYAITVGRLWRIHALLSPMLLRTFNGQQPKSWVRLWLESTFPQIVSGRSNENSGGFFCCTRKPKSLRHQVPDYQLWIMIAVLVAPQVLVQVYSLVFKPQSRLVEYNEEETIGRPICGVVIDMSVKEKFETIRVLGLLVLGLLLICLLVTALKVRKLPSLFNESKTIFDTTLISFVILVMGLSVAHVTTAPTTSPAITYMVTVISVLSITVNTSLRIVLPKLLMVWRGQTVIVSKLVMDHTRKLRLLSQNASREDSGDEMDRASILSTDDGGGGSCRRSVTEEVCVKSLSDLEQAPLQQSHYTQPPRLLQSVRDVSSDDDDDDTPAKSDSNLLKSWCDYKSEPFIETNTTATNTADTEWKRGPPSRSKSESTSRRALSVLRNGGGDGGGVHHMRRIRRGSSSRNNDIRIETDKAPSMRISLRMIDMQTQLERVTSKILTGLVVTREEWIETERKAVLLGTMFTQDVKFSWDEESPTPSSVQDSVGFGRRVPTPASFSAQRDNNEMEGLITTKIIEGPDDGSENASTSPTTAAAEHTSLAI